MADQAKARVTWGEGHEALVDSVKELDTLPDRLQGEAAAEPFMVDVTTSAGDSLSLGLGAAVTVLSWVAASGEPPYFSSLGDEAADGVLVFRYAGSSSEYPASSAISHEEGRQAVREFLLTGTRPANRAWTEV